MLNKKLKVLIVLAVVLLMLSTFCFATDTATPTSEDGINPITTEGTEQPTTTDTAEIHNGDLYLIGSNVTMDQLVDGNVYIIAPTVTITGKVNGNLFVVANQLTIEKDAYIVQSLFACANQMQINGSCGDLYATAYNLTMSYDSFVLRDLKVAATTFNFKGGVGRNAAVATQNFNFGMEENNSAIIYGDLNYSSDKQLEISNNFVQGEIKYSATPSFNHAVTTQSIIYHYVISFLGLLLLTLVIYLIVMFVTPKFAEKTGSYVSMKALPAIGIGLLTFILLPILSIMLMIIPVTTMIGFALLGIYCFLLILSTPIFAITITNKIKEKFALTKTLSVILTLVGVTLVIWLLQLIPIVNVILLIFMAISTLGIIFMNIFMKNYGAKKEAEIKTNKVDKKIESENTDKKEN